MSRSRKSTKKDALLVFRRPPAEQKPQRPRVVRKSATWLPPALAIGIVLVAGVVHGLQTNRWMPSREMEEAAARLQEVPYQVGDWAGTDLDVPEDQLKQAGAVAHLHRVYRHRITRKSVHVMVLCGPHGPISLHSPTVCFTGAGWVQEDPPKPTAVLDGEGNVELGRFFVCRFRKSTPTYVMRMRTCWAWNADGGWESPAKPRYAFAGAGHLYKVYVTAPLLPVVIGTPKPNEPFDKDVCLEFLRAFVPELKKAGI